MRKGFSWAGDGQYLAMFSLSKRNWNQTTVQPVQILLPQPKSILTRVQINPYNMSLRPVNQVRRKLNN